ncbi:MAG: hypothetical protein ACE5HI_03850 [bacterium]
MNSKRNKFDKKDSFELGEKAEQIFARIAHKKGWRVSRSLKEGNIHEHWDFLIKKDEQEFKVDVKALKRLNRRDTHVQDKWLWVELHGVREHDRGWLYNGKADLIAFETNVSFIIVKRTDLIDLVNNLVDSENMVIHPEEARYKIYSRNNRADKITLIEKEKLKSIKYVEWSKC